MLLMQQQELSGSGQLIPYTAWYKFDETSGTTVIDQSGNFNATSVNVDINQTGQVNKAYSFNGTNSYIQNSFGIAGESLPISFKFWFKGNLSSGAIFFGSSQGSGWYSGIELIINTDGSLLIRLGSGSGTGSTHRKNFTTPSSVVTANIWQQIIIEVQDMSTVNVRVNNVDVTVVYDSGTNNTLGWSGGANPYIGRRVDVYYNYEIDELTTYLGVWTNEQKNQMYENEVLGNPMM